MAENKRMRYFHDLNSEEQAEKIAQLQAWIDELFGERVRAALGLEAGLAAHEALTAYTRDSQRPDPLLRVAPKCVAAWRRSGS